MSVGSHGALAASNRRVAMLCAAVLTTGPRLQSGMMQAERAAYKRLALHSLQSSYIVSVTTATHGLNQGYRID